MTAATVRDHRTTAWFRLDIEGLRAVAVILVVLYHAGATVVSGGYVGVDVFFVISGFLITSLLLRELDDTRRLSIVRFYARRAVRLLPAATVVVATTLLAAWLWLPPLRLKSIAGDALATTVYGLNYRLADRGVDYLGAAQAPSPLQHFWSLAVEEQFYLAWPLLLLAASLVWRRSRRVSRPAVAGVLLAVIGVSLAASVWQTHASAPWAYFGAHTRAWELAVGALIAVSATHCARLPAMLARILGGAGLAAVLASALLFDESTAFPGYAATLPVAGTALVIAAGCAHQLRPLHAAALEGIGELSYAWYLWHWPMLLIAPYVIGSTLSMGQSLTVIAAALAAAVVTNVCVENPVRRRKLLRARPWRGISVGAAMSATVAAAAVVLPLVVPTAPTGATATDVQAATAGTAADRELAAAIAHSADGGAAPANLAPPLATAATDLPVIYPDGCDMPFTAVDVKTSCIYGDRSATTTMVLFGDSHAGHWFPALDAIAQQQHMRLAVVTKSACSAADVLIVLKELKRPYTECPTWRHKAWDYITSLNPAVVVLSSNGSNGPGGSIVGIAPADQDQAWTAAWTTTIKTVQRPGTRTVLISDTPWPAGDVPECVSSHPGDIRACARPVREAVPAPTRRSMVAKAAADAGSQVVDPVRWFCTATTCPAVVGNLLVFRDASHMTTPYAAALAPLLGPAMGMPQ